MVKIITKKRKPDAHCDLSYQPKVVLRDIYHTLGLSRSLKDPTVKTNVYHSLLRISSTRAKSIHIRGRWDHIKQPRVLVRDIFRRFKHAKRYHKFFGDNETKMVCVEGRQPDVKIEHVYESTGAQHAVNESFRDNCVIKGEFERERDHGAKESAAYSSQNHHQLRSIGLLQTVVPEPFPMPISPRRDFSEVSLEQVNILPKRCDILASTQFGIANGEVSCKRTSAIHVESPKQPAITSKQLATPSQLGNFTNHVANIVNSSYCNSEERPVRKDITVSTMDAPVPAGYAPVPAGYAQSDVLCAKTVAALVPSIVNDIVTEEVVITLSEVVDDTIDSLPLTHEWLETREQLVRPASDDISSSWYAMPITCSHSQPYERPLHAVPQSAGDTSVSTKTRASKHSAAGLKLKTDLISSTPKDPVATANAKPYCSSNSHASGAKVSALAHSPSVVCAAVQAPSPSRANAYSQVYSAKCKLRPGNFQAVSLLNSLDIKKPRLQAPCSKYVPTSAGECLPQVANPAKLSNLSMPPDQPYTKALPSSTTNGLIEFGSGFHLLPEKDKTPGGSHAFLRFLQPGSTEYSYVEIPIQSSATLPTLPSGNVKPCNVLNGSVSMLSPSTSNARRELGQNGVKSVGSNPMHIWQHVTDQDGKLLGYLVQVDRSNSNTVAPVALLDPTSAGGPVSNCHTDHCKSEPTESLCAPVNNQSSSAMLPSPAYKPNRAVSERLRPSKSILLTSIPQPEAMAVVRQRVPEGKSNTQVLLPEGKSNTQSKGLATKCKSDCKKDSAKDKPAEKGKKALSIPDSFGSKPSISKSRSKSINTMAVQSTTSRKPPIISAKQKNISIQATLSVTLPEQYCSVSAYFQWFHSLQDLSQTDGKGGVVDLAQALLSSHTSDIEPPYSGLANKEYGSRQIVILRKLLTLMNNVIYNEKLQNVYNCSFCLQTFRSQMAFMKHAMLQHLAWYRCDSCEDVFSYEFMLRHHTLSKHSLKCKACPEQFASKDRLRMHLSSEHGLYLCRACDHVFDSYMKCKEHCNSTHIDSLSGLFTCPICQTICSNDISKHMESHSCAGNARCSVCQQTFHNVDEAFIFKHKQSHAARVLKCRLCVKRFYEVWELHAHLFNDHWKGSIEPNFMRSFIANTGQSVQWPVLVSQVVYSQRQSHLNMFVARCCLNNDV